MDGKTPRSHNLGQDESVEDECLWRYKVSPDVLGVAGKALIKPEICPPLHGDKVPKPLVGKLVSHNNGHILLVTQRGFAWNDIV